jgi:MFS family permease
MTTPILVNTRGAQKVRTQSTRAAIASFLGAMLEYYDLYIYASASALIFNKVFFPDAGSTGLLLSLATFGVAYLARPIGAVVLGHFGDKVGRRNVLVATLVLMGVATFAIGCLPSYASAGVIAPALLVTCRLLQGFSAGGETAGATALTLEHAPPHRRGFFTSWTLNGIWAGYILASLVFIPISQLPQDALLSWGWRIPFWSSLIIVIVAFLIRRTLEEPEAFVREKREDRVATLPAKELFRTHRLDVLRVAVCALLVVPSSTVPVWGLSYASNTVGIKSATTLGVVIFGYAVALVLQPLFALLSDMIGRKPVFILGNLGGAAACFLFFDAVADASLPRMYLGIFLSISLCFSATNAIYPVFFTEMFNVRVRYSGTAIGIQIGLVVAGFAPALCSYWVGNAGGDWTPAALLTAVACVLAAAAALTAKETFKTPLAELGKPMS